MLLQFQEQNQVLAAIRQVNRWYNSTSAPSLVMYEILIAVAN